MTQWFLEHEVQEVVMESTAVLEAGVGSFGTVLAAGEAEAGRCQSHDGKLASGTAAVERCAGRPQERFWRRRTAGPAVCSWGVGAELRARRRAASGACGDAPQAATRGGASAPGRIKSRHCWKRAHIKLSSLVADLLGQSGRRMVEALSQGENRSWANCAPGGSKPARHPSATVRRAERRPGTASAIAVLLAGVLDDGNAGLMAVKNCGGITIVQDPKEAPILKCRRAP